MTVYKSFRLRVALAGFAILMSGCGEKPSASHEGKSNTNAATASAGDHSGWWCVEHAIPEAECSLCSAKFAAECKEKGDWCEEHNRAESHCFICDPSRAEKFEKLYEAKYGKKPPAATE